MRPSPCRAPRRLAPRPARGPAGRAARRLAVALLAALVGAVVVPTLAPAPLAVADDKLPGESLELTDKVRADAQKLVEGVTKGATEKEVLAARRGLLKMGPVVWPVVENAMRLNPPDAARPHLALVKALLAKKAEPEFEALRARLRRRFQMDDLKGVYGEIYAFRQGLPDPAKPGKRLPLSVQPTMVGGTAVFRSGDGSIVVGFGADADEKKPDAAETSVSDAGAGFVAAVGGKAVAYERQSGRGADTTASAPGGFAWAWASDGAPGKPPGGAGGVAGTAIAQGGAGKFTRDGDGGAGAPG